ncbi:MAG: hypothetical protein FJ098_04240, partial [Deltaproteobacteria bacterium]|nr:hypothetical protein [Deltaproteobacteria bacterium]
MPGTADQVNPQDAPAREIILGPDARIPDGGDGITPSDAAPPDAWEPLPCDDNSDCPSSLCVATHTGMACTIPCIEDCPAGWSCVLVPVAMGPDAGYLCLPDHITSCRPCAAHADCQWNGFQADGQCRSFGEEEGSFCITPCGAAISCLPGFACLPLEGKDGTWCLPEDGTC